MSSPRSIPTVDRISALPDSVICHILSFLSTKQSAATTILSKRWNPLWRSVLTLYFIDHEFADFNTFRLFVYSVMLTRDPTLPIRLFHLKCGSSAGCDSQDINLFVPVAVKKGIENLILDFTGADDHDFLIRLRPTISSVFNCGRNLVFLKLKYVIVTVVAQFDFPLLKTLHLDCVFFLRRDFNKLIEGCPILEELQTIDIGFALPNDEIEFKGLSNLVRADISNPDSNIPFSWICNAKFLRVKLSNKQQVHTFHNLTHMELIFESNWRDQWKWLVQVLQNCPKLQNLTIDQLYGHGIDEDDWKEPKIVPECISSQLRTCSLTSYRGTECELQFAKYIMKNAKEMRTMTITAALVDINIKHQMLLKLSSCPRGSTTCILSFY